ncbi:MAG: EmrA/EmrK family multidrug efflux transporter periplasmic adaptor subunit [Caulobacteraceae bacterium]|nr:EmrA/EmrK family multidrug efflux transporter periplasmic adaptor subunit [Caulobacteraceae bacterium]
MSQTLEAPAKTAAAAAADTRAVANGRRKRLFSILGIVVAAGAVIFFLYWLLIGSHHVTTDDAYVQADTAQVTALVSGAVTSVRVGDTQMVQKGQVLAVIDPTDFRLAVDRARAELGQGERKVRGYYANDRALAAQANARTSDIGRAEAQLNAARSDLSRAQVEYERRRGLASTGAVSGDELTAADNQLQNAKAGVATAQSAVAQARANAVAADEQRKVAQALIEGGPAGDNPEIAFARAHLAQAELDLSRTVIRAPVTGLVARKSIEIGQRVQAGSQMMSVVPVQSAFVDANFKEVQLRKIRIGAPVTLTSDVYGGRVKFHGKVVGIAGGSGASFALIPAQNATGNWIKVVQRVPVRIALDPKELAKTPLRVGLSMTADVDAG